jgi:hypothetical protein
MINRPKADRFVDASNAMTRWREMPVFGSFLAQISFILVKRRRQSAPPKLHELRDYINFAWGEATAAAKMYRDMPIKAGRSPWKCIRSATSWPRRAR